VAGEQEQSSKVLVLVETEAVLQVQTQPRVETQQQTWVAEVAEVQTLPTVEVVVQE
jgi:hypothetical protein